MANGWRQELGGIATMKMLNEELMMNRNELGADAKLYTARRQ